MRQRPEPTADQSDIDLFRDAVKGAVPLRTEQRRPLPTRPAPPVPIQTLLDEHEAFSEMLLEPITSEMAIDIGDEPTFLRDGMSSQVLKKLRRGHWVVQEELDLHGATREVAYEMVGEFLKRCVRRGIRCVRVIHGKGLGSKFGQPILKSKVKVWLTQRDEVLAYCQAPVVNGGSGALLVLLRN